MIWEIKKTYKYMLFAVRFVRKTFTAFIAWHLAMNAIAIANINVNVFIFSFRILSTKCTELPTYYTETLLNLHECPN